MKKIRKGDDVIVVSGKDKGKSGRVNKVLGFRVFVDGVNSVKKQVKANPNKDIAGGIEERNMSIHVSNVALKLPGEKGLNRSSKTGIKLLDGKRFRYFKSNGDLVDR